MVVGRYYVVIIFRRNNMSAFSGHKEEKDKQKPQDSKIFSYFGRKHHYLQTPTFYQVRINKSPNRKELKRTAIGDYFHPAGYLYS